MKAVRTGLKNFSCAKAYSMNEAQAFFICSFLAAGPFLIGFRSVKHLIIKI